MSKSVQISDQKYEYADETGADNASATVNHNDDDDDESDDYSSR
jgi:hypothetical protein